MTMKTVQSILAVLIALTVLPLSLANHEQALADGPEWEISGSGTVKIIGNGTIHDVEPSWSIDSIPVQIAYVGDRVTAAVKMSVDKRVEGTLTLRIWRDLSGSDILEISEDFAILVFGGESSHHRASFIPLIESAQSDLSLETRGYYLEVLLNGITIYKSPDAYPPRLRVKPQLPLETEYKGFLEGDGAIDLFRVYVPEGRKLSVSLKDDLGIGGQRDFDLYVRFAQEPTTFQSDRYSITASSTEEVVIPTTREGYYYIMVRSWSGRGSYKLMSSSFAATLDIVIRHTWVGDLKISLASQEGKELGLRERNGGEQDHVQDTYDLADAGLLKEDLESILRGRWFIKVQDLAYWDEGNVEKFALNLTYGLVRVSISQDREYHVPDLETTQIALRPGTDAPADSEANWRFLAGALLGEAAFMRPIVGGDTIEYFAGWFTLALVPGVELLTDARDLGATTIDPTRRDWQDVSTNVLATASSVLFGVGELGDMPKWIRRLQKLADLHKHDPVKSDRIVRHFIKLIGATPDAGVAKAWALKEISKFSTLSFDMVDDAYGGAATRLKQNWLPAMDVHYGRFVDQGVPLGDLDSSLRKIQSINGFPSFHNNLKGQLANGNLTGPFRQAEQTAKAIDRFGTSAFDEGMEVIVDAAGHSADIGLQSMMIEVKAGKQFQPDDLPQFRAILNYAADPKRNKKVVYVFADPAADLVALQKQLSKEALSLGFSSSAVKVIKSIEDL